MLIERMLITYHLRFATVGCLETTYSPKMVVKYDDLNDLRFTMVQITKSP